jgi:alcohol dehydrogenase class IV
MNSTFTLLNAGRVHAGPGSLAQLPQLAAELGARHVLIVSDKGVAQAGLVEGPRQALAAAGFAVTVLDDTPPEPEVRHAEAILAAAQAAGGADLVVGIGGGSAMDIAKLVAVLLKHPLSLRDLLNKASIPARGLPSIMVPTTAGTGSEATPNSIVLVPEDESKVGIVSPNLMPDAVILDPLLTLTLPPAVTASTGMDALTHAVECYCSKKGNPFSDLYGLEAIRLIARSIRRAFRDGQDVEARGDMLMGAFYGGVCIATSCTTAVHALAYPLGGKFRIAHGLSNAMLLPFVMEFNVVGSERRFGAMARAMGLPAEGLPDHAAADRMIAALYELNADLGIVSSLRDKGIGDGDLDGLVDGAAKVTRLLDNNPRTMTRADMRAIYQRLM